MISAELKRITTALPIGWVLLAILTVEVLSYVGQQFAVSQLVTAWIIIIATAAVSLYSLKTGLLIVIAELLLSSKGYLFAVEIAGVTISIRLALFLVIMAAAGIWMIREKQIRFFSWNYWKEYAAIVLVVIFGVGIGFLSGNELGTIFLDTNGYLYIGLILPLTQAIRIKEDLYPFINLFFIAIIATGIKTIVLLGLFSKIDILPYTLPGIYSWVRDTGVGEITRFPNGFSRIFFQTHIFMLAAFFIGWTIIVMLFDAGKWKQGLQSAGQRLSIRAILVAAVSGLVIFLSYSRSFWVAAVATAVFACIWFLWRQRLSWKAVLSSIGIVAVILVANYGIAYAIVNIPIPGAQRITGNLLTERTKEVASESAASSRIQLLQPMLASIAESPVIGSGLGTTVTYISNDPRVRAESPDGTYTTYAFEWGYLDLLLKFGIAGTIVLFIALWRMSRPLLQRHTAPLDAVLSMGALFGLIAVLVTHALTPYLNHPLGIGLLLLITLIASFLPQTKKPV